MLNKEECEKAVQSAEEKTTEIEDYNSIPTSTCCWIEEELSVFKQLIKEYFELVEEHNTLLSRYNALKNAQPYKFKDLKAGMWVWDDVDEDCRQIAKINEYGGIYWYGALTEYEADKFEEGRFYPIQYCALLMQED